MTKKTARLNSATTPLLIFGIPIYGSLVALLYSSAYLDYFNVNSGIVPILIEPATFIVPTLIIIITAILVFLFFSLIFATIALVDWFVDKLMANQKLTEAINLISFFLPVLALVVLIFTYSNDAATSVSIATAILSLSFAIYSASTYAVHYKYDQLWLSYFNPHNSEGKLYPAKLKPSRVTLSRIILIALTVTFFSSLFFAYRLGSLVAANQTVFPEIISQNPDQIMHRLVIYRTGELVVVKEFNETNKSFSDSYSLLDPKNTTIRAFDIARD